MILQVNDQSKCRLVTLSATGKFSSQALANYPGQVRQWPSLCKVSNNLVFLIGGEEDGIYLKTCLRYDIAANAWEQMPPMQISRTANSSCLLGDKLYVFCG